MFRRLCAPVVLAYVLASGVACTPSIDLTKSVVVSDVLTGWYDFGIVDGQNKLVPSIAFRLQNTGTVPLSGVEVMASFWPDGGDGENDSKQIVATHQPVAPGGYTNLLTVRSDYGAKYPGPRAEMFNNPLWKDFTIKLFAKRAGKIVRLGEYRADRRLLTQDAVESGKK